MSMSDHAHNNAINWKNLGSSISVNVNELFTPGFYTIPRNSVGIPYQLLDTNFKVPEVGLIVFVSGYYSPPCIHQIVSGVGDNNIFIRNYYLTEVSDTSYSFRWSEWESISNVKKLPSETDMSYNFDGFSGVIALPGDYYSYTIDNTPPEYFKYSSDEYPARHYGYNNTFVLQIEYNASESTDNNGNYKKGKFQLSINTQMTDFYSRYLKYREGVNEWSEWKRYKLLSEDDHFVWERVWSGSLKSSGSGDLIKTIYNLMGNVRITRMGKFSGNGCNYLCGIYGGPLNLCILPVRIDYMFYTSSTNYKLGSAEATLGWIIRSDSCNCTYQSYLLYDAEFDIEGAATKPFISLTGGNVDYNHPLSSVNSAYIDNLPGEETLNDGYSRVIYMNFNINFGFDAESKLRLLAIYFLN